MAKFEVEVEYTVVEQRINYQDYEAWSGPLTPNVVSERVFGPFGERSEAFAQVQELIDFKPLTTKGRKWTMPITPQEEIVVELMEIEISRMATAAAI